MSLEKKLIGLINKFKIPFTTSCAAYSLAVGLTLGATSYGCGKGDEPEEENQRYACQMNECTPDPDGPYAVSDCNNECGEDDGGNGQQGDYLTVTKDGMPECPLGWTRERRAFVQGNEITVYAGCSIGFYQIGFTPLPSPGGSAPCYTFHSPTGSVSCNSLSGSLILTKTSGSFRVAGNCSCDLYSAEFSLPLRVK